MMTERGFKTSTMFLVPKLLRTSSSRVIVLFGSYSGRPEGRSSVKLITPELARRSVECRAERWRSLYADMDVGRLKYGGGARRNSTLADTIQLVKSSAEPASTVLETAALQSMRLDHHISINL
jgi:hypothetical protein